MYNAHVELMEQTTIDCIRPADGLLDSECKYILYVTVMQRRRRVTKSGVEVGIADKKWDQTPHVDRVLEKVGRGKLTPKLRGSADPES